MEHQILEGERRVQHLAPQGSGEVLLTPETPVLCIHRGRNELDELGRFIRQPGQRKRRAADGDNDPGSREHNMPYVGDYVDTYDSRHYIIEPGYFTAPYGASLHFKARAVVPGSRNPETTTEASFISILGIAEPTSRGLKIVKPVDDREDWEPFTDEECAEYGMKVEALARDQMVDPIVAAADVQFLDPTQVLAGGRQGTPGKPPSRVSGAGGAGQRPAGGRRQATRIETTNGAILEPLDPADNAAVQEISRDRVAQANEAGRG